MFVTSVSYSNIDKLGKKLSIFDILLLILNEKIF